MEKILISFNLIINEFFNQLKKINEKKGMIFVHLGAGAGDLDRRANFRCGFTEFVKKNSKSTDKIFILEANPKNIPCLKDCYGNFSNVNIFNLGISTTNIKNLKFFYVDEDAPHFQVCSSKIDHIKKHYPNSIIKKFEVQSLTINEFFEKKVQKKDIDYLSIDLEGVDYDTLMSIDLTRFRIKNISVEYIHLKPFEKKNMINHLNNNGYSYKGYGYDHNNYDFLFVKKKILINRLLSKILWLIGNKHIKFLNLFISTK
tara:strand:- start:705 stop:1478 length:774 start_codon:yes stop_codon:yes gene_type:complete